MLITNTLQDEIIETFSLNNNNGDIWDVYEGTNPPIDDPYLQWLDATDCQAEGFTSAGCLLLKRDAYIQQVISTEGYHTIRIQIDVKSKNLEPINGGGNREFCYLYYRSSTSNPWIQGLELNEEEALLDNEDIMVIDNTLYNNNPSFEVKLGIDASSGNDRCYFDQFKILGIAYPTTDSPTTNQPSPTPTKYPTPSPTDQPSKSPTIDPTESPSNNPSISPTKYPTNTPSESPSDSPSKSPTKSPSDAPTLSPYVYCQQSKECQCKPTSECIFDCQGSAQCAGTTLRTAYNGQDIIINCIGTSACYGITGDPSLGSARSITWNCQGDDACKQAYLESCGFECELNCLCSIDCINERSCGDDYTDRINENQAFTCNGLFCITPEPSLFPTERPSDSPIAEGDPTRAPSVPTPSPSISPTNDPTHNPSPDPTQLLIIANSTTPEPLFSSTTSLSTQWNNTTPSPLFSEVTSNPTIPTEVPITFIASDEDLDENAAESMSFMEKTLSNTPLLGGICGTVALLCCICILVAFLCCRYKHSKRDKERMEKEAIEMSDINSPVKHVHSMSSKDHENITEDVVIKVKSGVASQIHEGAADVHIQHGQMHNVYGNGFNTGIKNLFPDISDDEIGNDDEKMAEEIVNYGGKMTVGQDTDDYQPPYMMDNMMDNDNIMNDPIEEFDNFQNYLYVEPQVIQGVSTADIDYAIDDE